MVTLGDVDSTSRELRFSGVFIDDDAFTVAVADADKSDAEIAGLPLTVSSGASCLTPRGRVRPRS